VIADQIARVSERGRRRLHRQAKSHGANLGAGMGKWEPDTGESIHDRLTAIVGAAMGYRPEDLPWEVPLTEFGLDSLTAVRIKNRVEYDFDLPPIQLRAVHDANLLKVKMLIESAIKHQGEAAELGQYRQTTTHEAIATEPSALPSEATPSGFVAPTLRPPSHPVASETSIPLPADPCGLRAPLSEDQRTAPPRDLARRDKLVATLAAPLLDPQSVADSLNCAVPPRDAAERLTFATWAIVTGKAPGGVFHDLPSLDDDAVAKVAQRLSERAQGIVTADDVKAAPTIEVLATAVRAFLEPRRLDGFVRTIRAREEGSSKLPVFVFHPAGGSTVVYEPLLKRLPPNTPMYGFERVEGSIKERAGQYVSKLLELQGNGPFVLAGWSLGGALAYACAIGLKQAGADVRFVGLIDTVHAGNGIAETKEEIRARWNRYARFAERTFNLRIREIPYARLEQLDDEGQVRFILQAARQSGVQIPGGILEHQRTSYLDQRAIGSATVRPYDGHVTLYLADRHHDDAIALEPRYALRKPDGGWREYISDLEVVHIGGDHIQVIDEPYIAKVGKHMSQAINRVDDDRLPAR
jgi:polyketide synthase 13